MPHFIIFEISKALNDGFEADCSDLFRFLIGLFYSKVMSSYIFFYKFIVLIPMYDVINIPIYLLYTGKSSHKHEPEWAPYNVKIVHICTISTVCMGQLQLMNKALLPVHWA